MPPKKKSKITSKKKSTNVPLVRSSRASSSIADEVSTGLMVAIRAFGHVPHLRHSKQTAETAERNLAKRLDRARAAGRLTAENLAELAAMDDASQIVEQPAVMDEVPQAGSAARRQNVSSGRGRPALLRSSSSALTWMKL